MDANCIEKEISIQQHNVGQAIGSIDGNKEVMVIEPILEIEIVE